MKMKSVEKYASVESAWRFVAALFAGVACLCATKAGKAERNKEIVEQINKKKQEAEVFIDVDGTKIDPEDFM